jgi:hypothetical protein
MKKPLLALVPCLALAVALTGLLPAGPVAADEIPAGARWTLGLEHGPLRIVSVRESGNRVTTYHYMRIKVTNPTTLPRPWNPLVEAVTDTKQVRLAVGYSHALEAIRNQERAPGLVCIESTTGKIEPEKSVETVAIFGRLDPHFDRVEVRIHGLVNPITTYKFEKYGDAGEVIVDAAYAKPNAEVIARARAAAAEGGGSLPAPTVEYREVKETRVFEIVYSRPGDEFNRDADRIRQVSEGWKVLGELTVLRLVSGSGS